MHHGIEPMPTVAFWRHTKVRRKLLVHRAVVSDDKEAVVEALVVISSQHDTQKSFVARGRVVAVRDVDKRLHSQERLSTLTTHLIACKDC
jgi:hypothetical protein